MYAYFLWTAILRQVGCDPDGDELYRLLLGMAPLTIGFSMLLPSTRAMADVHQVLRWLCLPMLLLVPAALLSIWSILSRVTFGSEGICTTTLTASWQMWWGPIQIVTAVFSSWMLLRVWRARAGGSPKL